MKEYDVFESNRHNHPINTYLTSGERQTLKQIVMELSEAVDTLNRVSNRYVLEDLLSNPDKVKEVMNIIQSGRPKPSNIPDATYIFMKACMFNPDVSKDNKLKQDCKMLLLANELGEKAANDIWYLKQNIAVPLGATAADRKGVKLSDTELLNRDKALFPDEYEQVESFKWESL